MRILVTGAGGFIGAHLWPELAKRHEVVTTSRRPLAPFSDAATHLMGDLEDDRFLTGLAELRPDAVVHLAAATDPESCEDDPSRAARLNESLPERLARTVSKTCRRFLYVSTDLVFDGENAPYSEEDEARPLSVYGASKLRGEAATRSALGERALVVRLALTYGERAWSESRPSFLERMIARATAGKPALLFRDELRTPIYVGDAALGLASLVERTESPTLVHLGGPERASRLEMGVEALAAWKLPQSLAEPLSVSEAKTKAPRPRDVSLDTTLAVSLGLHPRGLSEGILRMRREMERLRFMVGS